MEQKLMNTSKNLMNPANGRNLVFMFDDINMAYTDKWNHIGSNELLRQWLTYNGWYKPRLNNFLRVKDINFAASISLKHEE